MWVCKSCGHANPDFAKRCENCDSAPPMKKYFEEQNKPASGVA